MNRLRQLKTYPFSLFLWLEWILFGAALFSDLPDHYIYLNSDNEINKINSTTFFATFSLSFLSVLLITVMGFWLPKTKRDRWLYFALEIFVLSLPWLINRNIPLSTFSYFIIALRNGLIFSKGERWLANIVLFASYIPFFKTLDSFESYRSQLLVQYQTMTAENYQFRIGVIIASNLVMLALCTVIFWVLVDVLLKQYVLQQQLAQTRQQLQEYALKAEDRATVNERNRIAREIHDSLGHALTAQSIQLNNAIAFWKLEPDKAYSFLLESKSLVATALKEIRYSVATLRSDPLREQNLIKAIASLFQEFSQRTGITPHYLAPSSMPTVSKEVKTAVYRIVQEALTNIAKHSEAKNVTVKLQSFPRYLRVSIADDGKGFDPQHNTTGMGLQGIRERAAAAGGYLVISSQPNRGCILALDLPQVRAELSEELA